MTGDFTWLTKTFPGVEDATKHLWNDPKGATEDADQAIVDFAGRAAGRAEADFDALLTRVEGQPGPDPKIRWSAPAYDLSGRVVRVADGDTLTVLDARNRQHKIRLHSIDTPKTGQPYGSAARRALADSVAGEGAGSKVEDTD